MKFDGKHQLDGRPRFPTTKLIAGSLFGFRVRAAYVQTNKDPSICAASASAGVVRSVASSFPKFYLDLKL
jgi:hypothetical protein